MKILLIAVVLALGTSGPLLAQCNTEQLLNMRKTALVIGVKNYKKKALSHTLNDAQDIAVKLRKIGFEVIEREDLTRDSMVQVVNQWVSSLNSYQVSLFYFSGHGTESDRGNYLFPVDANITAEGEIPLRCYLANDLLTEMCASPCKYNIMLLDACRDNPYTEGMKKGLGDGPGLAPMSGSGAFVGFAASPHKTASDGIESDKNGVFATALLKYIDTPNVTIDNMFTLVTAEVEKLSMGKQKPYHGGNFDAYYCFLVSLAPIQGPTYKPLGSRASSNICSNSNLGKIVVVDTVANELIVYDANSFYRINAEPISKGIRGIDSRKSDEIVFLNSEKREIVIKSVPSLSILDEIAVNGTPTHILLSKDGMLGYILYADSANNGYLASVDLRNKKIATATRIIHAPSNFILSNDGKSAYVLSQDTTGKSALCMINLKNWFVEYMNGVALGKGIAISPDDKRLYFSYDSANNKGRVNVLDIKGKRVVESLPVKASRIVFTGDEKHILLTDNAELTVISADSNYIINHRSLINGVDGIIPSGDNRMVLFCPGEHNPFLVDSATLLKREPGQVLDPRVQRYNAMYQKLQARITDSIRDKFMDAIGDSIMDFPTKFCNQLQEGCEITSRGLDPWKLMDSLNVYSGFRAKLDIHAGISFMWCVKYHNGTVNVNWIDLKTGEKGIVNRKFFINNFDWTILKQEISNVYFERINTQLIPTHN